MNKKERYINNEQPVHTPMGFLVLVVILLTGLFTTGCEQPFEPLLENDRYTFSIFGYLDASADTQWVRMIPLRDTLSVTPGDLEMEVRLEHFESNQSVVLNDSLFGYPPGNPRFHANISWTTMPLEPEQTYRLEATLPDGRSSEVIVEMPPDFPPPDISIAGVRDRFQIPGVERLAAVQAYYHVRVLPFNTEYLFSIPHLSDTTATRGPDGSYSAVLIPGEDYFEIERALLTLEPIPGDPPRAPLMSSLTARYLWPQPAPAGLISGCLVKFFPLSRKWCRTFKAVWDFWAGSSAGRLPMSGVYPRMEVFH